MKDERERVEAVASVWRAIGQPNITGLALLCEPGGPYDYGKSLLGMPLMRGSLHGSDVPLAVIGGPDVYGEIVDSINGRFEKEARGVL